MAQTVRMPALSPTMTDGVLVKWLKNEGDIVKAGNVLAEIETDKATMEVEAVDEGILARILVPAGPDGILVNRPIAVILEDGDSDADLDAYLKTLDGALNLPENGHDEPLKELQPPSTRVIASPLARRIGAQENVDLNTVTGTGPRGRIVKSDVVAAMTSRGGDRDIKPTQKIAAFPADSLLPSYNVVPLSTMRRVIADRLTESKTTIPHFYLSLDCGLDKLLQARLDLNKTMSSDHKVSVNDFVIKAAAMALSRVPDANASFTPAGIRFYDRVDISVAVAVDGGLVTPIIRDAARKSLGAISSEMKDLASKARSGKLKPEDFQGGTFSISNLGMFGIREFAAVINPPQGGILAIGAGEERAIVKNGQIAVAHMMSCTLSADHRVIDGAVGARFLSSFQSFIQNPVLMLY